MRPGGRLRDPVRRSAETVDRPRTHLSAHVSAGWHRLPSTQAGPPCCPPTHPGAPQLRGAACHRPNGFWPCPHGKGEVPLAGAVLVVGDSSFVLPSVTSTVFSWPPRCTVSVTLAPGVCAPIWATRSEK